MESRKGMEWRGMESRGTNGRGGEEREGKEGRESGVLVLGEDQRPCVSSRGQEIKPVLTDGAQHQRRLVCSQ